METNHFKLTKWKGLDNWQCKHCPYATIQGLGTMMAHLHEHRLGKVQPRITGPVFYQAADEEE